MPKKFHQNFHMKSIFLPKCALLGCMLMCSNPISEFSAGSATGFSGLGSWLLAEPRGSSCCPKWLPGAWASLLGAQSTKEQKQRVSVRQETVAMKNEGQRDPRGPGNLVGGTKNPLQPPTSFQQFTEAIHPTCTEYIWGCRGLEQATILPCP